MECSLLDHSHLRKNDSSSPKFTDENLPSALERQIPSLRLYGFLETQGHHSHANLERLLGLAPLFRSKAPIGCSCDRSRESHLLFLFVVNLVTDSELIAGWTTIHDP